MTKTITVCARITEPLLMPDNVVGRCDACGWKVQFRPHAAPGKKRCLQCAGALIKDDDQIVTTKRMAEDYLAWKRKQRQ